MLVIERRAETNAIVNATEKLPLSFEARSKSRLRTRLESGEEVGLFLERGLILRGGDKLVANDGRIVEVVAAPEALMEANAADALLLARAAYHLGNRHVAVQIAPGLLRFATDHVLGEMVRGLDLRVTEVVAPFEPEAGAYGNKGGRGGHSHPQDGDASTTTPPRIHDHFAGNAR